MRSAGFCCRFVGSAEVARDGGEEDGVVAPLGEERLVGAGEGAPDGDAEGDEVGEGDFPEHGGGGVAGEEEVALVEGGEDGADDEGGDSGTSEDWGAGGEVAGAERDGVAGPGALVASGSAAAGAGGRQLLSHGEGSLVVWRALSSIVPLASGGEARRGRGGERRRVRRGRARRGRCGSGSRPSSRRGSGRSGGAGWGRRGRVASCGVRSLFVGGSPLTRGRAGGP